MILFLSLIGAYRLPTGAIAIYAGAVQKKLKQKRKKRAITGL
jgi:hypothetical protein